MTDVIHAPGCLRAPADDDVSTAPSSLPGSTLSTQPPSPAGELETPRPPWPEEYFASLVREAGANLELIAKARKKARQPRTSEE